MCTRSQAGFAVANCAASVLEEMQAKRAVHKKPELIQKISLTCIIHGTFNARKNATPMVASLEQHLCMLHLNSQTISDPVHC
jgi:hypothetical protein